MSVPNVEAFDKELTQRLRAERIVFTHEIYEIGEKYGLTKNRVAGRLKRFTDQGTAMAARVYVYNGQPDEDEVRIAEAALKRKLKDYPYQ